MGAVLRREYWAVGKSGVVWAYLDICPENAELAENLRKQFKVSSQYIYNRRLIAETFEVPVEKLPKGFERLD